MRGPRDFYTKEEEQVLIDHYPDVEKCQALLEEMGSKRSRYSIQCKASRMGLSRVYMAWATREVALIRDCLSKGVKPAEASRRLRAIGYHRSYNSVEWKMKEMRAALLEERRERVKAGLASL